MALKKKEEGHNNNERWLLTYSDLITLLMIFFVIMYAMSNVDAVKYQQLSESLNSAFVSEKMQAGGAGSDVSSSDSGSSVQNESFADGSTKLVDPQLKTAAEKIEHLLVEQGLEGKVSVSISERGVIIELMNTVLFESGSSDIRPEGRNTLIEIGNIAKTVDNFIRIEGNTDDVPINTERFPSNWELSVIRATEVLKLLISESGVSPEKISAVGYGEYRPTKPNTTPENRAQNRKVDIVILNESFNNSESTHDTNE